MTPSSRLRYRFGIMVRKQRRLLAFLLVCTSACNESQTSSVTHIAKLISSGSIKEVDALIHKNYVDPLGDKAQLLRDLKNIYRSFDSIRLEFSQIKTLAGTSFPNSTMIGAHLDTQLLGEHKWAFRGPVFLEVIQQPTHQIRSGLLSNVRDIITLMDKRVDAIESNSEVAYAKILHPNYRNGDENRTEAQARMRQVLNGKLRLRPDRYIVDLTKNQAHVTEWAYISRNQINHQESSSTTTANRKLVNQDGTMKKLEFTLRKSAGQWLIHAIHGQF